MKEPVAKYTLREILKNGTVYPQVVFTITAEEVAALGNKTIQKRPSLMPATFDAPDTMTVKGLKKPAAEDAGFKAEKDLMLVYAIFAKRSMKHNQIIKILAWGRAPYAGIAGNDDVMTRSMCSPPDKTAYLTPRDFRKNLRRPVVETVQAFYRNILAQMNLGEETSSSPSVLKIFSSPR